jgi:hypothetical protein
LDLTRIGNLRDFLTAAAAVPISLMLNLFHNGLSRPTKAEREAWDQHAATDRYLSLSEAAQIYSRHFEKAAVHRQLFYRYSAICEK